MEINNITRTFYRFLNEGKAESFRDAYYPEIDDYILNKIIEIDPESNGDDVSEWGKLLMKLNPTQSDIEQAGEDIAILAKAAKLGKDIPSLNDIENMDDLHYLAVDIANAKGNMTDDEINSQEESLNCPIVFDDGGFRVVEINSSEAAEFYGKGSRWPWSLPSTDGNMFEILSQRGSIYIVKNEIDNTIFSLMKLGNRIRITDYDDEPVNKNMFPQELISTIMNVNESVTKFIKEKNHRIMNEHVVKNIISALNENYSRRNIKGSELKNAMNAVCECVSKKSDINTVVKEKVQTVVESYNELGERITTEDYKQILNVVKEGFGDKIGDLAHRAKGKLIGTPEDAAKAGDMITNAIMNQLHAIYPNCQQSTGRGRGFNNTLIRICQMIPDKNMIDSLKNVIRNEVDYVLDVDPFTNYRNIEGCFNTVKEYFGGMEGIAYGTSDLIEAIKQAIGVNESKKRNTTVLKESELHGLLMEAVRKNVQRINEEFDEEYGEDPAWWEYGYEPGREGEMVHDFAERDNFERMRVNKQHREMDALATQRRNEQYFPEEENEEVRRWINGEDIFESAPIGGYADYEGEDINYESVYEQAIDAIIRYQKDGKPLQSAREIIDALGFREDSFNEEDWETVYSACEDALSEEYANGGVFESVKKRLNERRYSSDMIVWEMCPYCEEEVEVCGSDREPCCPRCGAHFSLSDEAIEMSITEPYDKGYVVIDGTGAVRGQFERGDYESAIEYANKLAIESGLKASFDVYGVERDGYSTDDDSTIIYSTYDNENELRNMMFNK